MHWQGIFCALWIPTDAGGRILESEFKTILEFARAKGVHGWFGLGSTGQFPLLEPSERKRAIGLVAKHGGSLPAVVNVSDLQSRVVAELGACARAEGALAAAILPPWYYPVSQPDQTEYFVEVARQVKLPLFLYNFPERTGNKIGLETIADVADRAPVVAIKHSGAEFEYHQPLVELGLRKHFAVFSGADDRLPETIPLGVQGCVSGLSNVVPELLVAIFEAVRGGSPESAAEAAERLRRVASEADAIAFPLNVAAAMEARGLPVGIHKMPVSLETRGRYEALTARLRALFLEWSLDPA